MAEQISNKPKQKPAEDPAPFRPPITEIQQEPEKIKKEKKQKKEKAPKEKKEQTPGLLHRISMDERSPKLLGLLLLLVALYLFVAFVSYLFTWKNDQNFVFHFDAYMLFRATLPVENKLGKLGAFVSHFFIYNGYGLASFLLVMMAAASGLNLLLRRRIFRLRRLLVATFFLLMIVSTAFSFVCRGQEFPYGGAFGNLITDYLGGFLGGVGTGILLCFIGIGWLIFSFNINFWPARKESPEASKPVAAGVTMMEPEGSVVVARGVMETNRPLDQTLLPEAEELPVEEEPLPDDFNPVLITKEPEMQTPVDLELANGELETDNDFTLPELPVSRATATAPGDLMLEVAESTPPEEKEVKESAIVREHYDPTLELSDYVFPGIDLLENYNTEKARVSPEELEMNKNQIVNTLKNYNIGIEKIKATIGPTVTLYEIVPMAGVRISKIKNLEDDIALSLSALGIRIIAPIPGKGTIGIEVPNTQKEIVSMRSLLSSEKFATTQMDLPIALGKTI